MLSDHERRRLLQRAPSGLLEATVLDPPVDADGFLRVELDNAPGQTLPPCPWPRPADPDAPLPEPGDGAAVMLSDAGNYWALGVWSNG